MNINKKWQEWSENPQRSTPIEHVLMSAYQTCVLNNESLSFPEIMDITDAFELIGDKLKIKVIIYLFTLPFIR